MTSAHHISGAGSPFRGIMRVLTGIAVAVGGLFILATSAILALFVTGALFIFGAAVVAYMWIKSKITGKPMMGARFDFRTGARPGAKPSGGKSSDGVTLDAHKTPEGWSVD